MGSLILNLGARCKMSVWLYVSTVLSQGKVPSCILNMRLRGSLSGSERCGEEEVSFV